MFLFQVFEPVSTRVRSQQEKPVELEAMVKAMSEPNFNHSSAASFKYVAGFGPFLTAALDRHQVAKDQEFDEHVKHSKYVKIFIELKAITARNVASAKEAYQKLMSSSPAKSKEEEETVSKYGPTMSVYPAGESTYKNAYNLYLGREKDPAMVVRFALSEDKKDIEVLDVSQFAPSRRWAISPTSRS